MSMSCGEEVVAEAAEQGLVDDLVGGRRSGLDHVGRRLIAGRPEILDERQRPHVQAVDPAHRERVLAKRELEQRAGCHYVQLGQQLMETAQRGDGPRAGLDLVHEEEVAAGDDVGAEDRPQAPEHDGRADVIGERRVCVPPQFEVDVVHVPGERRAAELQHAVGVADLARTRTRSGFRCPESRQAVSFWVASRFI